MKFGKMWYSEWEGGLDAGYEDLNVPKFGGADYEVTIHIDREGKETLKEFLTKKYGSRKSLEWMLLAECGEEGSSALETLCQKTGVQFQREIMVH